MLGVCLPQLLATAGWTARGHAHLDVAVQQLRGVHILERLQQLVHDVRLVDVLQDVGSDDGVQVGLHILKHQVDVAVIFRLQDIQDPARNRGLS